MQQVIVALGTKNESRVKYVGASDLVRICLRLAPLPFLYHSVFLIPVRFRDRPEYKNLVLRLTRVQQGWLYGD
jgi:hypothetical protein